MFRTVCPSPTLWESLLPPEALVMPAELSAVDRVLDDPRFFEPFRRFFDPVFGRPSIPMETYLRIMFLKYRYRLGYDAVCREVTDSLSWLRFCRIPIGETAPHPSTLVKLTTRCGTDAIEELNATLITVGVEANLIDTTQVRADTTVVPANIKYPTDSGLLTKGVIKTARLVARIQGAGIAPLTPFRDQTPVARRHAHRIGSKLRRRSDEAKAEVLVITGELADVAESTVKQARAVLRNARRVRDRPVRRLRQWITDLDDLLDAIDQVIAQTRVRLGGDTPDSSTRRVSLHDPDARPIRKGSLAKPTQFGYTGQVVDNVDGVILDYELEAGIPPDGPRLVPAIERTVKLTRAVPDAVTADRGYGEAAVTAALRELGVETVAIPTRGKTSAARRDTEAADDFVALVKWRTGAEGRISTLKRQHGWDRTRLAGGLRGARTWCGWGVLSHNLIHIGTTAPAN